MLDVGHLREAKSGKTWVSRPCVLHVKRVTITEVAREVLCVGGESGPAGGKSGAGPLA